MLSPSQPGWISAAATACTSPAAVLASSSVKASGDGCTAVSCRDAMAALPKEACGVSMLPALEPVLATVDGAAQQFMEITHGRHFAFDGIHVPVNH